MYSCVSFSHVKSTWPDLTWPDLLVKVKWLKSISNWCVDLSLLNIKSKYLWPEWSLSVEFLHCIYFYFIFLYAFYFIYLFSMLFSFFFVWVVRVSVINVLFFFRGEIFLTYFIFISFAFVCLLTQRFSFLLSNKIAECRL